MKLMKAPSDFLRADRLFHGILSGLFTVASLSSLNSVALAPQCNQIFTVSEVSAQKPGIVISRKKMAEVVKTLLQTMEFQYGPRLPIKEKVLGIKWTEAKARLLGQVGRAQSESDLVFLISDFLHSFNDAHISIQLPSSLTWKLPMQVSFDPTANKYVINAMNPNLIMKSGSWISGKFPPIGAELVAINGKTPDQMRVEIPAMNSEGNELTNKSLFGTRLFRMAEASGIPLSRMKNDGWDFEFQWTKADGNVAKTTLKLKYAEDGVGLVDVNTPLKKPAESVVDGILKALQELTKNLQPEKPKTALSSPYPKAEALAIRISKLFSTESQYSKRPKGPRSRELDILSPIVPGLKGKAHRIGQTEPLFELPKDFKKIELPDSLIKKVNSDEGTITKSFDEDDIFAGTFIHKGKRVGLLRIPTYSIDNVAASVDVIDYLVKRLEMTTDYLVIDQMHNPGGAVVYSDFWIHALVGKYDNSKHLHFRVKPTSGFLREFVDLVEQFGKETIMLPSQIRDPILKELEEQRETVYRAFREGKDLSDPITLLPMTKVLEFMIAKERAENDDGQVDLFAKQPEHAVDSPAVYTKPIHFLTDEYDFSGGDATPASLVDYGRIQQRGARTAGAGGTVEEFTSDEINMRLSYHLTTSLMFRPLRANSQPYVENFGVEVEKGNWIHPTVQDYKDGFKTFLKRVLNMIDPD